MLDGDPEAVCYVVADVARLHLLGRDVRSTHNRKMTSMRHQDGMTEKVTLERMWSFECEEDGVTPTL